MGSQDHPPTPPPKTPPGSGAAEPRRRAGREMGSAPPAGESPLPTDPSPAVPGGGGAECRSGAAREETGVAPPGPADHLPPETPPDSGAAEPRDRAGREAGSAPESPLPTDPSPAVPGGAERGGGREETGVAPPGLAESSPALKVPPGDGAVRPEARVEKGRGGRRTFRDLEQDVKRFTEPLSRQARSHRARWRPHDIRWLYRVNRKEAVRQILDGRAPPCPIPLEDLQRHFEGVFAREDVRRASRPAHLPLLPSVKDHGVLEKAFTPKEVLAAFLSGKDPAPGPDGIRYSQLKEEDPTGKTMASVFEECRQFKRIPPAWKGATTNLIFKGGQADPELLSSWRPIAVCNTMYKWYARCLAARISQWAQAGKLLTPQRGNVEQHFVLQSVLHAAVVSERECTVAFLDLADAFGSIFHCHIFETLAEFGMPGDFIDLLRELYSSWTTTVKASGKETAKIPLRTGLKQGCPLSHVMFRLAIEPLLRFINNGSGGFRLYGTRVSVLAYVDDLLLVAESAQELQSMLDDATAAADWIGLRFNAGKCKSLHFKGETLQATKFTIQKKEISSLKEGETVRYLGMPIGLRSQSETIISDLKTDVDKIEKSRLTRGQKADMLNHIVLPRTLRALRGCNVGKGGLGRMDDEISRLPYPGPRDVVELSMADLSDIEVVDHAFHMLTSPDEVVKNVARGALRDIVRESFSREQPDEGDFASYLNGFKGKEVYGTRGDIVPLWIRARGATRRLRELVDCKWIYGKELCVKVSKQVIVPKQRNRLVDALKRAVVNALAAEEAYYE